jgi:hypothetical protein
MIRPGFLGAPVLQSWEDATHPRGPNMLLFRLAVANPGSPFSSHTRVIASVRCTADVSQFSGISRDRVVRCNGFLSV